MLGGTFKQSPSGAELVGEGWLPLVTAQQTFCTGNTHKLRPFRPSLEGATHLSCSSSSGARLCCLIHYDASANCLMRMSPPGMWAMSSSFPSRAVYGTRREWPALGELVSFQVADGAVALPVLDRWGSRR